MKLTDELMWEIMRLVYPTLVEDLPPAHRLYSSVSYGYTWDVFIKWHHFYLAHSIDPCKDSNDLMSKAMGAFIRSVPSDLRETAIHILGGTDAS